MRIQIVATCLFVGLQAAWAEPAGKVSLGPADCARLHLPPIQFSVDATGQHFVRSELDHESYLTLSGPPGGPRGFQVLPCAARSQDEFRQFVQKRYGRQTNFQLGKSATTTVAGASRSTLGFLSGAAMTQAETCVVWLAADKQRPGLALVFSLGTRKSQADTGLGLLEKEPFRALAQSFSWGP